MKFGKELLAATISVTMLFGSFGTVMADETDENEIDWSVETKDFDPVYVTPAPEAKPEDVDYATAFVSRLYSNMLGREADKEGLEYWSGLLKTDSLSGNEVADCFYYSDEFKDIRANIDNEEFVNILYATILGREADEEGFKYWTDLVDSCDTCREDLYDYFKKSDEWATICETNGITREPINVEDFVERLYSTVLGRPVDESGKQYWVNEMVSGRLTAINAANAFFGSNEYNLNSKFLIILRCPPLIWRLTGQTFEEANEMLRVFKTKLLAHHCDRVLL